MWFWESLSFVFKLQGVWLMAFCLSGIKCLVMGGGESLADERKSMFQLQVTFFSWGLWTALQNHLNSVSTVFASGLSKCVSATLRFLGSQQCAHKGDCMYSLSSTFRDPKHHAVGLQFHVMLLRQFKGAMLAQVLWFLTLLLSSAHLPWGT